MRHFDRKPPKLSILTKIETKIHRFNNDLQEKIQDYKNQLVLDWISETEETILAIDTTNEIIEGYKVQSEDNPFLHEVIQELEWQVVQHEEYKQKINQLMQNFEAIRNKEDPDLGFIVEDYDFMVRFQLRLAHAATVS